MKRILIIFLCLILFVGCSTNTASQKEAVTIHLPEDDTVNGYRVGKSENSDRISWSDVKPTEEFIEAYLYCGNKNSKKFHKKSCTALKTTKEENKVYFKTREDYFDNGYAKCGICNP